MEKEKTNIKPKEYTHIDYEALLTYVMKNHISVPKAMKILDLDISRQTVVRNIKRLNSDGKNYIINLYQNEYSPNMQKKILPIEVQEKIDELEENDDIVKKHKLEDLYKKLNYVKEILDTCDGNYTAAAKQISSGNTILGKVKISRQGLIKDLKYFENVKKEYEQYCKEKEKRNKKEETR